MKVKELFRRLLAQGWTEVRVKGSHRLFQHPRARRPIPVPVHGADIPEVIAKAILKQARDSVQDEEHEEVSSEEDKS